MRERVGREDERQCVGERERGGRMKERGCEGG